MIELNFMTNSFRKLLLFLELNVSKDLEMKMDELLIICIFYLPDLFIIRPKQHNKNQKKHPKVLSKI